ncbi:uncharacterized protein L201_002826 [Kwoniella dendrophila CBS 6074]|uniref:DUF7918 domain-containing protein n=1 Tax=Kwoniella dendrophila CBS 6074 TaxID=1295534 RepID=A0AAX4JRA3_9TREE
MFGRDAGIHFDAWVGNLSNEERLNEYQITHHPASPGQSAWSECFLEATEDEFQVKISKRATFLTKRKVKKPKDGILGIHCDCMIDGQRLPYNVWWDRKPEHQWKCIVEKDEIDGKMYHANLKFAPLQTTDDPDQVTVTSQTSQKLGTIEIILWSGYFIPGPKQAIATSSLRNDVADEKSKKFSYTVSPSTRTEMQQTHASSVHIHALTLNPDYKFVFKYRPRPVLLHTGIIDEPAPPPQAIPDPPKRKRSLAVEQAILVEDDENIDRDVKPDLERKRMKYLEDQVKKLSSEQKHLRKSGKTKAEAVDLTLDDD